MQKKNTTPTTVKKSNGKIFEKRLTSSTSSATFYESRNYLNKKKRKTIFVPPS